MEIYPECSISHKLAAMACMNPTCNQPAFICKQCPNNECTSMHIHNSRQSIIKWDEVFRKLIITKWQTKSVARLQQELNNLTTTLEKVRGYLQNAIGYLNSQLSQESQLNRLADKLESGKHENVTGSDINQIMELSNDKLFKQPMSLFRLMGDELQSFMVKLNDSKGRIEFESAGSKIRYAVSGVPQIPTKQETTIKTGEEHYNIGIKLFNDNRITEAKDEFALAIQEDSTLENAFFHRGLINFKQGLITDAIADFTSVTLLNPSRLEAFKNRAAAYISIKQYVKAERDLNKIVEMEPENMQNYRRRAELFNQLLKFEKAEKDLTICMQLQPSCCDVYLERGRLYYEIGQMMKAEKDLSKAIFLKPTFDAAYDLRGRVYQDLKKYDCALTDFGRAVTLRTDPLYLKSRADLYILMGRIEDAKHDMDLLKKLQRM